MHILYAAFAAIFFALVPIRTFAADWSQKALLGDGRSDWTEVATDDSSVLRNQGWAKCVNSGSTNFTVWEATPGGAKLHPLHGPVQAGVDCSPAAGNITCGSVILPPGYYVFSPDATGASAFCVGGK